MLRILKNNNSSKNGIENNVDSNFVSGEAGLKDFWARVVTKKIITPALELRTIKIQASFCDVAKKTPEMHSDVPSPQGGRATITADSLNMLAWSGSSVSSRSDDCCSMDRRQKVGDWSGVGPSTLCATETHVGSRTAGHLPSNPSTVLRCWPSPCLAMCPVKKTPLAPCAIGQLPPMLALREEISGDGYGRLPHRTTSQNGGEKRTQAGRGNMKRRARKLTAEARQLQQQGS